MIDSESLVGSYVLLQVNARAMVAGYGDSPIWAVATALETKQYIALVEKEVQIPTTSYGPLWRVYRVSFVGSHMHGEQHNSHNGCMPIFPASMETKSASFKSSQPLPYPNCCHRPSTEAFIRVHRYPLHESAAWTLSDEQIARLSATRKVNIQRTSPETYLPSIRSDATSLTFRSPALLPRDETNYLLARLEPSTPNGLRTIEDVAQGHHSRSISLSTLADLALSTPNTPDVSTFLLPPPARITTPSSDASRTMTPVSAIFERAPQRTPDAVDTSSVYTSDTTHSSIALNLESASTSKLVLGSDIDMDEFPLVDLSFGLDELSEIVDPAGFSEERDVVMQLVQKAKERQRSALAARLLPSEASASPKSGHDRRLSLVNVRSRHSVDTAPSVAPRAPRKLRRSRSYQSTRRSASKPRSERSLSRKESRHFKKAIASSMAVQAVADTNKTQSKTRNPIRRLGKFLRSLVTRFAVRVGSHNRRRHQDRTISRPPSRQSQRNVPQ